MLFKGSMTAIVTPFADGRVDEDALQKHVDYQISKGIDVIAYHAEQLVKLQRLR